MAERNVRVSETLKRLGASSFVIFNMHLALINGHIICFAFHGRETECGRLAYHNILFRYHNSYCGHMLTICFHLIVKRNNVTALLFEGGRK